MAMKDQFLIIKNYINEISLDDPQEYFEYDYFPFIQNVLNDLTSKEQDNFAEKVFTWPKYEQYIIAYFLSSTDFKLKGKHDSGYVFCECFSKIDEVEYLTDLAQNLEIQLIMCKNKNELSVPSIINNLYVVINSIKDVSRIDHYLKIINEISTSSFRQ